MPHANPFTELDIIASEVTSSIEKVPNSQPKISGVNYRLAIIGEAPGNDEIYQKKPFVGFAGKELDRFLSRFGIIRDACFIGNICQHQPAGNKLTSFAWDGPEITAGIKQLHEDLVLFRPNIILLLGGAALHVFRNPNVVPKQRKAKDGMVFAYPDSIGDWRGSFFTAHANSPLPGVKCLASYHPSLCLRQYDLVPMLMMDIKRAFDDAGTATLELPQRDLRVRLSFDDTIQELDRVISAKLPIGTDIEGYWNNWTCISFATSPSSGFIVPLTDMRGQSYWTLDEEVEIFKRLVDVLSDPAIPKIWQNGLYDRFCTQYGYSIVTRGPSHDIMLKHWELYCELEKSLAVQASLYTREPYYKSDRGSSDRETYWRYCCKDSAVTIEIDQRLNRFITPPSRSHYDFNLTLLNSLLYMEFRGIRYDSVAAKARLKEVNQFVYSLQHDLDSAAGYGIKTSDPVILRALVRDTMCYKSDSSRPKKGFEDDHDWAMRVLHGDAKLTKAELGRLSVSLGMSLNIKSPKWKTYLYTTLGLPEQRDPQTKAVTADYEALITLKKKSSNPVIQLGIDIGELRTRSQFLEISTDNDGRVRAGYNIVGSETGRVTCYTSPTGSGYNMQTIPDENELKPEGHPLREGMRDLLLADPDCYLAKCDLKGADGWTVGANLAALGDSTMLDDLRFGLKPASILCYGRRHGVGSIAGKTRQQLAEMCKEVKKSDWDYFAYKQCIWGFCYLMGVRKATQHVFNVSEGSVTVPESDMQLAKDMLFKRYNIQLWHRAMEQRLFKQPYPPSLVSPSGHIRKFFGRKTDIVGQALAHEPQSVTTYATNKAVYNCWTDPDNRIKVKSRTHLRVEPMHQVHDEFLCQFHISDTAWAIAKIKQWFANPVVIAGVEVIIPFDGAYGTNWAMSSGKKGNI